MAEKEFIGIDDRELDMITYSPVCSLCKHFNAKAEGNVCEAFQDGIPEEIWRGDNDHKKPYSGDSGIHFERV